MEIKTHALLLSLLVVTGAMTIDAYAQSNTQRIADIDDNTSAIKTVVDAINTMVSSLSDAVEAISSSISGIESTLTSVDSSVDEVKSSVATISADVTTIKSSITGFDAVAASIGAINNKITSIEDRLSNIETSIVSGQSSADSTSLQMLSERMAGLSLTIAAIDNQLDAISAELGVIRNTTSTSQTTQTATGFFEDTTTKTITNYDYKQHGKKTTVGGFDRYELDMTFTCSADVFLDTADMTPSQRTNRAGGDGAAPNGPVQYLSRHFGSAATADNLRAYSQINYINVDGRTLYNNNFLIGPDNAVGSYVEYDKSETFENRKLTAGAGLKFETRIYDGEFALANATTATDFGKLYAASGNFGTDITDATTRDALIENATKDNPRTEKNEEIELYTVEVTWSSFNSATCSISIGGASAIGADTPYSNTFGAAISGDGILKTYENTLDCGGNPLTITGITGASGDDNNLANFGTLELTVLDGNNEDTADVTYKFRADGDNWALDENDDSPKTLPLTVSGHDVKISGTFPGKSLIIQLEYNSVPNAGCTIN